MRFLEDDVANGMPLARLMTPAARVSRRIGLQSVTIR
jgi:hypothetical protein